MKDQTRNLHPIPEAVFAMYHWHKEYAQQGGGSMDFYDSLSNADKKYCERAVKQIKCPKVKSYEDGFMAGFKDCQEMVRKGEHASCCLKANPHPKKEEVGKE